MEILAPPTTAPTGRSGFSSAALSASSSALHQAAGVAGQVGGDIGGAGVRPVGGGKGVIDIDVRQAGQGAGHLRVVVFLARVEAGVFQDQDFAGFEFGDGFLGDRADAIVGEEDVSAEHVPQGGGDGAEGHVRHRPALWAVEMADDDDARALFGELADGGAEAFDAGEIGDDAVAQGHVEVRAEEDAPAGNIGVVEGLEVHEKSQPCLRPAARPRGRAPGLK